MKKVTDKSFVIIIDLGVSEQHKPIEVIKQPICFAPRIPMEELRMMHLVIVVDGFPFLSAKSRRVIFYFLRYLFSLEVVHVKNETISHAFHIGLDANFPQMFVQVQTIDWRISSV